MYLVLNLLTFLGILSQVKYQMCFIFEIDLLITLIIYQLLTIMPSNPQNWENSGYKVPTN